MASVRAQIRRDVVPVVSHLKAMQHARTGVADPKLWDDVFQFPDGMAAPHGTPDEIMAAGKEMYHSLSPETSEFIDEMFEAECFDVLSKPGKAQGGYCTSLPEYKLPFIFSNFNGTADDVDVLTHEAGHAFADWIAARKDIPELLRNPGMESCEIHSMSMEFLTSDYYHLFYGEDTAKAMIAHAADSVYFLPYGSMVDEFQHIVYSNPDMTPAERNAAWAKLETEYRRGSTSAICRSTAAARAGSVSCTSTCIRSIISTTALRRWSLCASSPHGWRIRTTRGSAIWRL